MNYLQSIKMFCFLFGEKRKNMIKETNAKTLKAVEAASEETTEVEDIELHLKPSEAEIIRDLLNNFVYAYRSDREVDYKRELVPREKVGNYPYVAAPADPSIINPAYDWVNKKWYSKNGSNSLPEIAQSVANLNKRSTEQDQAALANGQQMQMITKQLGNQMTMMKQMQQTLTILAKNSQSTSQNGAQTTPVQPTANPTVNTDTNGGNN